MKNPQTALLLITFASALHGCGAPPTTQREPSTPASASKGAPTSDSPLVAPPKDLILVGRVRSYAEWLGVTGKPAAISWLEQQLVKRSPILVDLDWSLPTEFAATYDPMFAPGQKAPQKSRDKAPTAEACASEGEESDCSNDDPLDSDDAKSQSFTDNIAIAISVPLRSYSPESYRKLGFEPGAGGTFAKNSCLVSPALGTATARLICAPELSAAQHLTEYLTRGLPLETLSSAPIFAELRPKPLIGLWGSTQEKLRNQLAQLVGSSGPTATIARDIGLALLGEATAWVNSSDSVRIEVGPAGNGNLQITARVVTKSNDPWLLQSYLATAESIKELPAPFLGLPVDMSSIGYQYGLPEDRASQLQGALLALGRTALKEYGPIGGKLPGKRSAAQSNALDRIAGTWVEALNAPCLRAEHFTWAGSNPGAFEAGKKAVPTDQAIRVVFPYQLIAAPTKSQCPMLVASLMDSLELGYGLLPKSARSDIPLQISKQKTEHVADLPPITVRRITVPKKSLDALFDDDTLRPASSGIEWAPAKGSATLTIMTMSNAGERGADWLGFGFDEKAILSVFRQILHPDGKTLRDRADIAQLARTLPLGFSEQRTGNRDIFKALLPGEGKVVRMARDLLTNMAFTTTTHVARRSSGSEVTVTYGLSPQGMESLRTLLGWDKQRFDEIAREASEYKAPLAGPVGVIRVDPSSKSEKPSMPSQESSAGKGKD